MQDVLPGRVRRARDVRRRARAALPRHAGRRVHDRARPALPPADAGREANRRRGAARGGRHSANEELIAPREAVQRIDPAALDQLLHPTIDPDADCRGRRHRARRLARRRVRPRRLRRRRRCRARVRRRRRDPRAAGDDRRRHPRADRRRGVLTARGGMTSHAAVVARGMGKPCVAGCAALHVDVETRTATIGGHVRPRRRRDHDRRRRPAT